MDDREEYSIERIEMYITATMSQEDRMVFEKEMNSNQPLREQVELLSTYPDQLSIIKKTNLKSQILSWLDQDNQHEKKAIPISRPNRPSSLMWYSAIAASILLLVAALVIWPSSPSLDQQAQSYINEPFRSPLILRGEQDPTWLDAIELFNEGQYQRQIDKMQPIIEDDKATNEQLFYYGLAHLKNHPPQFETALNYFSIVEQRNDKIYLESIFWHRALIALIHHDVDKAILNLNLLDNSGRYRQKKDLLLKQIDTKE